jgi:ABC-type branched-subunit amino acid transport system permease subunit
MRTIDSVNYSAYMILVVPIVGALVFFLFQEWLSYLGVWYPIVLNLVAIVVVLFAPLGLWGS